MNAIDLISTRRETLAGFTGDIERLEASMADAKSARDRIESTATDISKSLADVREKASADHVLIQTTAEAVKRIEGYFLQKGTGAS